MNILFIQLLDAESFKQKHKIKEEISKSTIRKILANQQEERY